MAVVSGTVQLKTDLDQTVSSGVVSAQNLPATLSVTTSYANGTGANQVDLIYAKQIALVASTPQTLDLTSLTDLSGASINFARVRVLDLQVVTTTSGDNVTLGDAASNAWAAIWGATGTHTVMAGSRFVFNDPTSTGAGVGAVVSGTSKSLKIDPGSANVTINLIIAGCSAV